MAFVCVHLLLMVDKRMYIPSSTKIYCSTPVHDAVQLKKPVMNGIKDLSSAAQLLLINVQIKLISSTVSFDVFNVKCDQSLQSEDLLYVNLF